MNQTFYRCQIQYGPGVLQDANGFPVVIDVTGYDVVSASVVPVDASISPASLRLRWAESIGGPWFDFGTTVTIDNSARASGPVQVAGKYVGIYINTGSGASQYLDATLSVRRTAFNTDVAN